MCYHMLRMNPFNVWFGVEVSDCASFGHRNRMSAGTVSLIQNDVTGALYIRIPFQLIIQIKRSHFKYSLYIEFRSASLVTNAQ